MLLVRDSVCYPCRWFLLRARVSQIIWHVRHISDICARTIFILYVRSLRAINELISGKINSGFKCGKELKYFFINEFTMFIYDESIDCYFMLILLNFLCAFRLQIPERRFTFFRMSNSRPWRELNKFLPVSTNSVRVLLVDRIINNFYTNISWHFFVFSAFAKDVTRPTFFPSSPSKQSIINFNKTAHFH